MSLLLLFHSGHVTPTLETTYEQIVSGSTRAAYAQTDTARTRVAYGTLRSGTQRVEYRSEARP